MKPLMMLAVLALAGGRVVPAVAAAPAQSVGILSKAFLAESIRRDPLFASSLGIHTEDARLADLSAAGHAARIAWLRGWREHIELAGSQASSADDRADARELLHTIDLELFEDVTLRPWQTDPSVYVDTIGSSLYILVSRTYAPRSVRLANVARRLVLIPAVAAAAETNLTHPTRTATLQAIDANAGNIELVRSLPPTPAIERVPARWSGRVRPRAAARRRHR
jgi:hypothetical protein